MSGREVIVGVADGEREDNGCALIVEVDGGEPGSAFVRLHSWNDDRDHGWLGAIDNGMMVRVTVEYPTAETGGILGPALTLESGMDALSRALFDAAEDHEADMLQDLMARAGYLLKCDVCGATRDRDLRYCEFGCDVGVMVRCTACGCEWVESDGVDRGAGLECPSCHTAAGNIVAE